MANNLNTLIEKIKDSAVARCRERIELAADKARGVLNGKRQEDPKDSPTKREPSDMTSCLKRQHGL
jgi:hypothetical protein